MLDLGFLFLMTLWAAGLGRRVLSWLGGEPEHPVDALALAVPIGLGLLALEVLGLAELGLMSRAGLAALMVAGMIIGGDSGWALLRAGAACVRVRGWIDVSMAIGVVGTLLTALAPVTDGDALCYHLQVPKIFLADHAARFDPDLHETVYPLGVEMLYAVALEARGPVACRLVQWVTGLIFAGCVTAIARPLLGDRAHWAGAVAMLTPAVSNGMGAPLNDVALAASGNAALLAWIRWAERPSAGRAALAGMLAGMALGVKYPALVWATILGAGMIAVAIGRGQQKTRPFLRDLLIFAAVAILIGCPWYLRAYLHTGNPVHPFFRRTFGGAGIDDVLDPIKRPMAVTGWNLLTALAAMTLRPDRFDSLAHQFGPAFLLFLPTVLLLRPSRRVVAVVAMGMAFLTACLCVRQSTRFVLIAAGPMAVGVAWAAASWEERRTVPGRAIVAALALLLLGESALCLARSRHGLGVVFGRESTEAYLVRREPTFRVGSWIGHHLPNNARIVGQDHRGFYLPRPYSMELAHRRRTGLGTRGETPEAIVDHLIGVGFTHLLLCPPEPLGSVEFDPTLGDRLRPWLAVRRPLYREAIRDPDGIVRRYEIYELAGAPVREARR